MATHSGILVWKIPWAEDPGGLQSIVSQTVRTEETLAHTCRYNFVTSAKERGEDRAEKELLRLTWC